MDIVAGIFAVSGWVVAIVVFLLKIHDGRRFRRHLEKREPHVEFLRSKLREKLKVIEESRMVLEDLRSILPDSSFGNEREEEPAVIPATTSLGLSCPDEEIGVSISPTLADELTHDLIIPQTLSPSASLVMDAEASENFEIICSLEDEQEGTTV